MIGWMGRKVEKRMRVIEVEVENWKEYWGGRSSI